MGKKSISKDKKDGKKLRQEKKQEKMTKKEAKKHAKDVGEENIEDILAEIMSKEAKKKEIIVQVCDGPPSCRANFTLSALSSSDDEMILFGGEYYDGDVNVCYNDLFRWHVGTNEWKFISSPNSPPPRCSHQACVYRDHLYVFGGEFATADQFYHYRDLWRLDLKTNAWECIETKTGPSPRSGHRMTVWRNYLVLFGGFYEASRETRWYNDLFLFNLVDMKWKQINFPSFKHIPDPRSGCQLVAHPTSDYIFLYGGFAKVTTESGGRLQEKVYTDMWSLSMNPVTKKQDPAWERLSRKGSPPTPRCGASMTVYKNRAILFGGVIDEEGHRHTLKSTFYNDMFAFDMDRRRWFKLDVRNKKKEGGRRRRLKKREEGHQEDAGCERDRMDSDNEYFVNEDDEDEEKNEEEEEEEEPGDKDDDDFLNRFGYVDANGRIVYISEEDEEKEEVEPNVPILERNPTSSFTLLVGEEEEEEKKEENELLEDKDNDDVSSRRRKEIETKKDVGVDALHVEASRLKMAGCQIKASSSSTMLPSLQKVDAVSTTRQDIVDDTMTKPLPRINPALVVRNNTLYVYGGVLEEGDREITLDDCWSLDMKKLDQWNRILEGTMKDQLWRGEASDTEDGSSMASDGEEGSETEEEEDEMVGILVQVDEDEDADAATASTVARAVEALRSHDEDEEEMQESDVTKKKKKAKKTNDQRALRKEMEALQEQLQLGDSNLTPLVGENLRDFFARTANYWSQQVAERFDTRERQLSMKDIKREGFALAEKRYQELLPVLDRINTLEKEQKEMEAEVNSTRKEKSRR